MALFERGYVNPEYNVRKNKIIFVFFNHNFTYSRAIVNFFYAKSKQKELRKI